MKIFFFFQKFHTGGKILNKALPKKKLIVKLLLNNQDILTSIVLFFPVKHLN